MRWKEYEQLPFGHFSLRDVNSYRRLYSRLPNTAVTCEVGSFQGKSLCAVADIVKAKNISINIVDAFGDVVTGENHDPDLLAQCKSNLNKYGILDRAQFHVGYSNDMAPRFTDRQFDLVFIDANHETPFVRQDIALFRPKLKVGGILCGHDYGNPCGVKAAVDLDVPDFWRMADTVWANTIDDGSTPRPYLARLRRRMMNTITSQVIALRRRRW
jgi:methyltransferase family protein